MQCATFCYGLPYTNKNPELIGKLDSLIVGRSNVIYESGETSLLSEPKTTLKSLLTIYMYRMTPVLHCVDLRKPWFSISSPLCQILCHLLQVDPYDLLIRLQYLVSEFYWY